MVGIPLSRLSDTSDHEGTVTVSRFAADTGSIPIYDSIAAFMRRPRTEPHFECG